MIQVEDEKMIFLDANAFYSYYGRSKLGMTSEPVDEERLKKYLEQQREKSLPTSVYIEIMTHFRNNPKVLQNLLEFRYAKGLPLFNNIPDYVVSEDEITSVAYMDQAALKNYADRLLKSKIQIESKFTLLFFEITKDLYAHYKLEIAMVDSNLQREKILPSEKAFAYKMRLEAMKHQGRAEADTSDPLEPKCKTELVNVSELEAELQKLGKVKIQKKGGAEGKRSNEQLASMVGESVTQIKRYIRLTHLIPKILDMVDKEILAIRSAVEISFLSEEEQYELHAVMELEQSIPNISQANRLKRMSQQKCLDMNKIYEILQEIKPNQKEQIKLPLERIGKYFPTAYTPKQQVDLIEKLLKNWAKQNVK